MKVTKDWITDQCTNHVIALWNKTPEHFPGYLLEYSEEQKNKNEEMLIFYQKAFQKKAKCFSTDLEKQQVWRNEIWNLVHEFMGREQVLGISQYMSPDLFGAFEEQAKVFVRKTRAFDRELLLPQIWQGIRNFFIYAMIQDFLGHKQNCIDPVFSYSLLYPYTDNFIDDPGQNRDQKAKYNHMIEEVLHGKSVNPDTSVERKTVLLLQKIQDYYSGDKKKEIENLLLLMLKAQEESIRQGAGHHLEKPISEEELLKILSFKGGISVLNDYAFHVGELDETEAAFYLAFGFLLQLSDDLQDFVEDEQEHCQTLMVRAKQNGKLEKTVNRLLHYIWHVITDYQPRNKRLKEFAIKNCVQMVLLTVGTHREAFSEAYLKEIEKHLPVHVDFIAGMAQSGMAQTKERRTLSRQMEILDILVQKRD